MNNDTSDILYIRAAEAAGILNIGLSTWYAWLNLRPDQMPSPIYLSRRCVVYSKSEVLAFAEKLRKQKPDLI